MDSIDKQLLNIIQSDFPLSSRPFDVLADDLGVTEDEAIARVRTLVESGLIRRIGASFDTRKLGHKSLLIAAKVPPERLAEVAATVSTYPEVTHNYGREHEYNLWFTLICRDGGELERVLSEIETKTGISDMRRLPASRLFKIKVEFDI